MIEIRKTEAFSTWIDSLREVKGRARVLMRIERLAGGNPGDVEPVGESVSELRVDFGPGCRVYYKKQRKSIIVLLAGGDKSSQRRDIEKAKQLARNL